MEDKNYHNITINDICALAGKTKVTFYHYFKDKDELLVEASINLINKEYNEEYSKILRNETDLEKIEYLSLVATYNWVTKHYDQIHNLIYKGDTLPFDIFKKALFNNYHKYMDELVDASGYDIPSDYLSVFSFAGLYGSCLYYANQLKNNTNKTKVRDDTKRSAICLPGQSFPQFNQIEYSEGLITKKRGYAPFFNLHIRL